MDEEITCLSDALSWDDTLIAARLAHGRMDDALLLAAQDRFDEAASVMSAVMLMPVMRSLNNNGGACAWLHRAHAVLDTIALQHRVMDHDG